MDLITTEAGPTSNSYTDLSDADALAAQFRAMPGLGISTVGWFAAASPQAETRKQALVEAVRRIDSASPLGQKVAWNQARNFPRVGLPDCLMDNVIPEAVKRAQVAEACALLEPPKADDEAKRAGVVSRSIGSRSTTYDAGSVQRAQSRPMCEAAQKFLIDAGLIQGSAGSVYLGGR